ncbi:MAG: sigma-70 family RNA polymerase sigma factor [Pirellulales bacterium]
MNQHESEISAEQLLTDARQGMSDSLGRLLQMVRAHLLLVAQRELPADVARKVAPSDVVQDTLAEGAAAFDRFHGQDCAQLRGWLAEILRANILDAVKRYRLAAKRDVRRERFIDSDDFHGVSALLTAPDSTPSGVARRLEAREALLQALHKLEEPARTVVTRRSIEGRSYDEIGRELGLSAEAVRKRWQRAIANLSILLRDTEEPHPDD